MNNLEAAAERAELTGRIRSFMVWLGEGRTLTEADRIDLAEARIVEWMKAARLIRVTGGRLVPVKKNAALTSRPLDLVLALLEAYPGLGQSLFPRNAQRESLVGNEFGLIGPELLTRLLISQGPRAMNDLEEEVAAWYQFDQLSDQEVESLRGTIRVDVTIAVAALGDLGVVDIDRDRDTAELNALGRFAIRRLRGMAEPGDPVMQVRITLKYVDDPPVWRRVLIPAAYPLSRVHRVIQAAMGWEDCHLHSFQIGKTMYGPDLEDEVGLADETKVRLADVARVRTRGAGGFEELKELLAGPPSEERDEVMEWAYDYDPARFDLAAANAAVAAA